MTGKSVSPAADRAVSEVVRLREENTRLRCHLEGIANAARMVASAKSLPKSLRDGMQGIADVARAALKGKP